MADYGYGNCPKCVGTFKLTKVGVMRHHLGDVYEGQVAADVQRRRPTAEG